MRPAGDCHLALLQAAHTMRLERINAQDTERKGATLREMVQRSQVGYAVARRLVDNMRRYEHLVVVGEVRVDYRNRKVAEYAPAADVAITPSAPMADLTAAMQGWARST